MRSSSAAAPCRWWTSAAGTSSTTGAPARGTRRPPSTLPPRSATRSATSRPFPSRSRGAGAPTTWRSRTPSTSRRCGPGGRLEADPLADEPLEEVASFLLAERGRRALPVGHLAEPAAVLAQGDVEPVRAGRVGGVVLDDGRGREGADRGGAPADVDQRTHHDLESALEELEDEAGAVGHLDAAQ